MCDGVTLLLLQDLIIFPDDCEFKRVNQCTTGRVYVLKFKAGSKRLFFWMQVRKCSFFCKCVHTLNNIYLYREICIIYFSYVIKLNKHVVFDSSPAGAKE